jgi:hypothetical protein
MRTKQIVIFAVVALALLMLGNFAYNHYLSKPQTSAAPINTDDYLQREVEKKLESSGVFKQGDKVTVTAHDGLVTLTGIVQAEWKKISAGNQAASTPAVLEVENLITVVEPAVVEETPWKSGEETPRKRTVKGFGRDSNDPHSRAQEFVAQGNDYVARKQYAAAVKAFQSALALDPNNYEARSGLQEARNLR